jgi:NAD(P) transhydrogenase subunit alpha
MKVAITKETRAHEKRVAVSPDTVKRMIGLGLDIVIESDAGLAAAFTAPRSSSRCSGRKRTRSRL